MKPATVLILVSLFGGGNLLAQGAQERCSPWTDWSMPSPQGLAFSFRQCETPSGRVRIEWRWANMSEHDLSFSYTLYTRDPGNCEQRTLRGWANGKRSLPAGRHEDTASGRKNVATSAYDFRLYWCTVTEGGP